MGCGCKVSRRLQIQLLLKRPWRLITGAWGTLKAKMGWGLADAETIAARRDACRACPHATKDPDRLDRPTKGLTSDSICRKCGCNIKAKTTVKRAKCPDKRWTR